MSAAPCQTFGMQRFFDVAKAADQCAILGAERASTAIRYGQRRKARKAPVN